uniref:G/U mismatch-specific DNA glycosylase n=1 Tax=Cupriavidus yeoncheonensis TaxID=1462994 RepID=UPI003F498041
MKHPHLVPPQGPSQPLSDVIKPGLLAVFCGLNPGLRAATSGYHFAGNGNRFWRAIYLAGFIDRELGPADGEQLLLYGYGMATAVSRPTASANALSREDYVDASLRLIIKLERFHPNYVAFLGKAAYAAMISQRIVNWGAQRRLMGGSKVWVLPNPSGRNRGFSLANLVDAYSEFRTTVESETRREETSRCDEVNGLR